MIRFSKGLCKYATELQNGHEAALGEDPGGLADYRPADAKLFTQLPLARQAAPRPKTLGHASSCSCSTICSCRLSRVTFCTRRGTLAPPVDSSIFFSIQWDRLSFGRTISLLRQHPNLRYEQITTPPIPVKLKFRPSKCFNLLTVGEFSGNLVIPVHHLSYDQQDYGQTVFLSPVATRATRSETSMPLEQATAYRDLPVQKVSREGLHEQVVEQMQELIFEKHLRSGSRLPGERELCQRFGVSRTVIREASKVLAQRGLLVIEPGRGTFVTLPAEHDVARSIALFARARDVSFANLVEVRRALEPEIAELAAARATETHRQRLRACIEVMDRSLADPEAYVTADQEFHSVLAEATGNDIFIAITGVIVSLAQNARRLMFAIPEAPDRGQSYHRRILECIAASDGTGARSTMFEHLRQVEQDIVAAATLAGAKDM